jgi:hypothetical protein
VPVHLGYLVLSSAGAGGNRRIRGYGLPSLRRRPCGFARRTDIMPAGEKVSLAPEQPVASVLRDRVLVPTFAHWQP